MSRVGKSPIKIPAGVKVSIVNNAVSVKGDKGSLNYTVPASIALKQIDDSIVVEFDEQQLEQKKLGGTTRARLQNIVEGVSKGFEIKLTLLGVGYRANVQNKKLNLTIGFSHPVEFAIPADISIEIPTQTEVLIKGIDKSLVGQVAATIRKFRPPEVYKGKGIRYADEVVKLKETKKK